MVPKRGGANLFKQIVKGGEMAEVAGNQSGNLRLWVTIVLGFVVALGVMVACAYLWVFIYSVLINTTGDQAFYEAYAQTASPVVAVVTAFQVFYLLGRYMRRFGDRARFAALAAVGINLMVDALAVASVTQDLGYMVLMSVLSAAAKIAGALVGTRQPTTAS